MAVDAGLVAALGIRNRGPDISYAVVAIGGQANE